VEGLVLALDREDLAEDPFEARVAPRVGRQVGLEESLVAAGLDLGEVGYGDLVGDPAEVPSLARDDTTDRGRSGHGLALQRGDEDAGERGAAVPGPTARCAPARPGPGGLRGRRAQGWAKLSIL